MPHSLFLRYIANLTVSYQLQRHCQIYSVHIGTLALPLPLKKYSAPFPLISPLFFFPNGEWIQFARTTFSTQRLLSVTLELINYPLKEDNERNTSLVPILKVTTSPPPLASSMNYLRQIPQPPPLKIPPSIYSFPTVLSARLLPSVPKSSSTSTVPKTAWEPPRLAELVQGHIGP